MYYVYLLLLRVLTKMQNWLYENQLTKCVTGVTRGISHHFPIMSDPEVLFVSHFLIPTNSCKKHIGKAVDTMARI